MGGNMGELEENINLWVTSPAVDQLQTTIYSSLPSVGEVEQVVKRAIQSTTPLLVEESVKREMQTLMPPLVEAAVRKGIQDSVPALAEQVLQGKMQALMPLLVEQVLEKGMQALTPLWVEEIRKVFGTFLVSSQSSNLPSSSRSLVQVVDLQASRNLQLHFECQYCQSQTFKRIYTGRKLTEQGILLKVVLRDDSGNIVEVGAESSIKVKIVVLQGDVSADNRDDLSGKGFQEQVVKRRENKPSLLVGKCEISLRKGVADVDDIAFTDNSSWVRSGKFRLGAEVSKTAPTGVTIREAISEAFMVKERRGECSKKKETPALGDEVWRLRNIAKDGKIHTRLEEAKINTVNDLLQVYDKNADSLKKILQVPDTKFQDIVKHATSAYSKNNQLGYHTNVNGGNDAAPLAYENPNGLFEIGGLNHQSLLTDYCLPDTGFFGNMYLNIEPANLEPYCAGNSDMQLGMVPQLGEAIHMFQNSSPHNLNLTADNIVRVQEIENDLRACTSNTQRTIRRLNKPRWCSVGAALRFFSLFRIVIKGQASRARKRQRVH